MEALKVDDILVYALMLTARLQGAETQTQDMKVNRFSARSRDSSAESQLEASGQRHIDNSSQNLHCRIQIRFAGRQGATASSSD